MHVLVNETGKKHMICKSHNTFISRISCIRHWTTWITTVDFNQRDQSSELKLLLTPALIFPVELPKVLSSALAKAVE